MQESIYVSIYVSVVSFAQMFKWTDPRWPLKTLHRRLNIEFHCDIGKARGKFFSWKNKSLPELDRKKVTRQNQITSAWDKGAKQCYSVKYFWHARAQTLPKYNQQKKKRGGGEEGNEKSPFFSPPTYLFVSFLVTKANDVYLSVTRRALYKPRASLIFEVSRCHSTHAQHHTHAGRKM